MEPTGEQPERSDNTSPLSRSRPGSFDAPIQRRPPLSRGTAPQSMARRPISTATPSGGSQPAAPVSSQPESPTPLESEAISQEPLAPPPPQATEPEPVIQMPQPASLAPPAVEEPVLNTPATPAPQQPISPVTEPQPAQRLDFTPPKQKKGRWWFKPAFAAFVVLALGIGIFGYAKVLAARNNPDRVMQDALAKSLSIATVQSVTKSGPTSITAQYDFTNGKNPIVNVASSLTSPKGPTMINGYGDLKNSYVNYASLPSSVPKNIAKQMSNTWVQVRQDGELPKNTPDYIVKASDPRYQAFGPIIMGNFDGKTREQLLDFIMKNKVYKYEAEKAKKETLGEETVLAFPIKLDVSYLKVASQSAAVSMGLEPSDTQMAVDAMETLRDAKVTLYIRTSDHTIARMYISKDGVAKTIDLSGYKETELPDAPQTKLLWHGFTPLQNQIESSADLTKVQY